MKLANLHLVTGYAGYEHVTAADQGAFNAALLGSGEFVINRGNKLAATFVDSNTIRIADGDIYMQGRFIRLNSGEHVDLSIEGGKSGYMRNDLIVARYTKNAETGVEEVNLMLYKGTAVTSNPVDPVYTRSNIVEGKSSLHNMPLYRVTVDGLTVKPLEQLFTVKNWLIPNSADDIGAAPDGFGLGKAATNISGTDLLDTLKAGKGGKFRGNNVANSPDTTKYFYFEVTAASNTYSHVTAYRYGGGVYEGSYDSGKFSGWSNVYDEANKPNAADVGLGNVPNVPTNDQTPTFTKATTLADLASGEKLSVSFGKIAKAISDLISHLSNKSNPHNVTAVQVKARPETWTPDAEEVGALPKTGGVVSGDVTIEKGTPMLALKDAIIGRFARFYLNSDGLWIRNGKDDNNFQAIYVTPETGSLKQALRLYRNVGGAKNGYDFLHTGNLAECGVAKIESGSYVGTDTYGADNPNRITFPVAPKIVLFFADTISSNVGVGGEGDSASKYVERNPAVILWGVTTSMYFGNNNPSEITFDGNTMSWYTSVDAKHQFNENGVTYRYVWFA